MSSAGDSRSDYRERIRLARERVQAAQRNPTSTQPTDLTTSTRETPTAANTTSAGATGTPQMMQGTSQDPQQNQWPLEPTAPAQVSSHEQQSAPPPRPYRSANHSWFPTGSGHSTGESLQSTQRPSQRQQVVSRAQTESIYSQTETFEDSLTAGPSRSSYVSHPSHQTSHHSSVSSIGDIPDFPVPQHEELYQPPPHSQPLPQPPAPTHPRRTPNLGPPPAAGRRGASSVYSHHQSFVSPIPEESPQSTPRRDRFSVMAPSEVNLDPVDEDAEQTFLEDRSEDSNNDTFASDNQVAYVTPGMVRKASIGRKAKPSLTLVRSGSSTAKQVSPQTISEATSPTTVKYVGTGTSANATPAFVPSPPDFDLQSPAGNASERGNISALVSPARSVSPLTPVVEKILSGLEKGGALSQGVSVPQILEADSVQARPRNESGPSKEDRVSTTSLADLIRRATKVRTNLDRGRTASRLGMLDMFSRSKDKLGAYEKSDHGSMRSSMSGMIGWMPPRATATEMGHMDKALEEGGPSRKAIKEKVRRNRRKRCCGMPQWLFLLVLLLLIGCITAAIVVPVELLVVPHQNHGTGTTLANCQASDACQNGGSSVVLTTAGSNPASTCSCVCVNGYTGPTCQTAPDTNGSCAQDVTGVLESPGNATMGSAIRRLLTTSMRSKFGIDLNATAIVGAFNQNKLGCVDENTLVTFGGQAQKRSTSETLKHNDGPMPTPAAHLPPRDSKQLRFKRGDATSAFTSASLVLAASAASGSPTSNNATASSPASPSATGPPVLMNAMDFGRVALLYILQQSNNYTATQFARSRLNTAFNMPIFQAQTITFDSVSIDLNQLLVSVNGISQGGTGAKGP